MFSSAVKLADLDDFLASSQDCIKPIVVKEEDVALSIFDPRHIPTERPNLIKAETTNAKARVNLTDCLACSGCVTSAEAVLIESQSHEEVLKIIAEDDPATLVIISLSVQSLVALSTYYATTVSEFTRVLDQHLRRHGFDYVFETDVATLLYHRRCKDEYDMRFGDSDIKGPRLLSSQCPGVVCYAEKTAKREILDHLSITPSIQLWQGLLCKSLVMEVHNARAADHRRRGLRLARDPVGQQLVVNSKVLTTLIQGSRKAEVTRVFCVSVEPCYDKKLDAVRPEFLYSYVDQIDPAQPLLDIVLSTDQLLAILISTDFSIAAPWSVNHRSTKMMDFLGIANLKRKDTQNVTLSEAIPDVDGDSGGVANALMKHLTEVGKTWTDATGLNNDHKIFRLSDTEGRIASVMHSASGLRNIKNVADFVLKKHQRQHVASITLLACPKGCLNGGGHLALKSSHVDWTKMRETFDACQMNSAILTPLQENCIQAIEAWLASLLNTLDDSDHLIFNHVVDPLPFLSSVNRASSPTVTSTLTPSHPSSPFPHRRCFSATASGAVSTIHFFAYKYKTIDQTPETTLLRTKW